MGRGGDIGGILRRVEDDGVRILRGLGLIYLVNSLVRAKYVGFSYILLHFQI